MTDIDYGALFDVELDTGAGEKEAEPAEPHEAGQEQAQEEAQGEKETEAAGPSEEMETETPPDSETEKGGDPAGDGGADENARYAAARRKAEAERDAAIKQAKEDAQAEAQRVIDEAFAHCGLHNPWTGKTISSKAEYDEYRTRYEAERRERIQKQSGMSDTEFKEFVGNLPEVRAARQAQAAAEEAAAAARAQQAQQALTEALREISALDPGITQLSDLAKTGSLPRITELVKKGVGLADAYKLANFDALTQRRAEAARTAAIASAESKAHLKTSHVSGGAGLDSVPADIVQAYREFCPDATALEIQKHYNSYIKK